MRLGPDPNRHSELWQPPATPRERVIVRVAPPVRVVRVRIRVMVMVMVRVRC